jgi:hypothetical protein
MNRNHFFLPSIAALFVTLFTGPILSGQESFLFERFESIVGTRSASLVSMGEDFAALYSRPAEAGIGSNLYFRPALNMEETRVNETPNEVLDGGENGPILLRDGLRRRIYAVWNASDPRHNMANMVRFAAYDSQTEKWGKTLTVNDDVAPSTHTFHGAAVAPDGIVYVAWLDRRELPVSNADGYPEGGLKTGHQNIKGTVALYLASSRDQGKTFQRNVRVAGNVCPCCRAAIGFSKGNVLVAWRSVEKGDIRDISISISSDQGKHWSEPKNISRDNWNITGCPQVGPTIASAGDRTYLAWYTDGEGGPGTFLISTVDGGRSFSTKRKVSASANSQPFLAGSENAAVLVFRGPSEGESVSSNHDSVGKHDDSSSSAVFICSLKPDGSVAGPIRVPLTKGVVAYPLAALANDGLITISWKSGSQQQPLGYLITGFIETQPGFITK